jgi:hypothetical protein
LATAARATALKAAPNERIVPVGVRTRTRDKADDPLPRGDDRSRR